AKRVGDAATFSIFRRDELREVIVTLAERPVEKLKITPASSATDAEKSAYAAWLGTDWTPPTDE
ncbi:MAG TPA: M61 family peptidase, partial [Polyangia bacterium]